MLFALMQAGRLAGHRAAKGLQPTGVALRDYAALSVADRLYPLVQAALADRLGMSEVTAAKMVAKLKQDGLLERFYDVRDFRGRVVQVTAAGQEAVAAARVALDRAERELLEPLREDERRQLRTQLLRLAPEVRDFTRRLRLFG